MEREMLSIGDNHRFPGVNVTTTYSSLKFPDAYPGKWPGFSVMLKLHQCTLISSTRKDAEKTQRG